VVQPKLKNILGDFSNRPGFRSNLHGHVRFHDLATHWSHRAAQFTTGMNGGDGSRADEKKPIDGAWR